MSTHIIHRDSDVFYFCTFTCYNWLPLIEKVQLYDKIYNWFDILNKNRCYLYGFVIMPNHVHLLVYLNSNSPGLSRLIANGKRFLAYEIVKRLKNTSQISLLSKLSKVVPDSEKYLIKRKHKVFRTSFDAMLCYSEEVILQKLNYLHYNPVNGKWNLSESYLDYNHSSANFYDGDRSSIYPGLIHYKDIFQRKYDASTSLPFHSRRR